MRADVTVRTGHVEILLGGRFDHGGVRVFREALIKALREAPPELRIELTSVDYIDSTALGSLLMAREMAGKEGKRITLAGATGMVRKALDIARFGDLFALD